MDDTLESLAQQCVVKLTVPGRDHGTGFFVAPGLILTCAHVVGDLADQRPCDVDIQVTWKKNEKFAIARATAEKWLPHIDAALLGYRCEADHTEKPPCALLGESYRPRDALFVYGYPDNSPAGSASTLECEGDRGNDPPLMKFKLGNIRWGMSGSPVLNQRTGRVCGMVKLTLGPHGLEGGAGVTAETIFHHFPELVKQQQQAHEDDPRWLAKIGAKAPGDLVSLVQDKIADLLAKPKMEGIKQIIETTIKEEHQIIARSDTKMAAALIEMDTTESMYILLLARKAAVTRMQDEGKNDRDIANVRTAVIDLLGWLVLLAVNAAWLRQNRKTLYPQAFPGAIAIPVQTETGVEIIHAAINARCAQFKSTEGRVMGAERMPGMEHEFLEEGFDPEDIVHDIKSAIFMHINRKRGLRDTVPDTFTPEVDRRFNAKLRAYNRLDRNVYLVVRRSGRCCPLNDSVYCRLKADLPDLQVIFQEAGNTDDVFNVDEIDLDSTLEVFFDSDNDKEAE